MYVEFGAHQKRAIREMSNGCILRGGVGTGKSRTALGYFTTAVCGGMLPVKGAKLRDLQTPKDIYIITTAKKRDDLEWESECASFGFSTKRDSSFGSVKVTVDSWNNITKYKEVTNGFFIFDEQRLVGNGAWVKSFLDIAKSNQWIMLSATPGDAWIDYVPVFIAHGFYRNRSEFLRRHVVYNSYAKFPKIERYVDTGTLQKHRKQILVDMPFARHTTRHVKDVFVEYDEAAFKRITKDRWHIYEERPIRDISELFALIRKVVNTDPSRLGATMELMERHPKLIIFYNFNYELDMLRTLGTTFDIPVAEWNGHKHEKIPESDRWLYLVQYTAGAEGWNCVTTDAMIFYSLNYAWRVTEQAKGRIDRLNTPYTDLYYYQFRSGSMIDQGILRSLSIKEVFNESLFAKEVGL